MNPDIINTYFPGLDERQKQQFAALGELYTDWNAKINVVSRKDIDNLYENHVLHSLSLGIFLGKLADGTSFLDIGTGGGFPGIPLAILYPGCTFHLIDRIGKKITVAKEVAAAIGLENVTFQHGDIKECRQRYEYVVSRAVMPLNDLYSLVRKNILAKSNAHPGNRYAPGLVCLKGGDLTEESKGINRPVLEWPVTEFIDIPHFSGKKIVYIEG